MTPAAPLTLAIGRGRTLTGALPLLHEMGFQVPDTDSSRVLEHDLAEDLSLLTLRNWDVPVYVSEGAADMGIVSNDILAENPDLEVYAPLDLKFGLCRLALAAPRDCGLPNRPRIASRHTHLLRQWFQNRGRSLHLIKLYGSLESAPARGLADGICDLVQTGRSLKENNLVELDTLMQVSARLVINKASARSRMARVDRLVQHFADAVGSR